MLTLVLVVVELLALGESGVEVRGERVAEDERS